MKKKTIKAAAVTMALSVLFANVAFAESQPTLDIKQSRTYTEIVEGTTSEGMCVNLDATGISATMTGYVDVKNTGYNFFTAVTSSYDNSSLKIEGTKPGTEDSVIVNYTNISSLIVPVKGIELDQTGDTVITEGNVRVTALSNGAAYGVDLTNDSKVVTKDIVVEEKQLYAMGDTCGVRAFSGDVECENITVKSNQSKAYGIIGTGDANVIAKSITSSDVGISVDGNNAIVVVTGDVTADTGVYYKGASAATVVIEGTLKADDLLEAEIENLANSYFYALQMLDKSELDPCYNYVNYIIKTQGATEGIQLSGVQTTKEINGKTYDYANGGNAITVTVKNGYDISSPIATKNADGTYTIIVPNGGGVSIEAIKTAIAQAEVQEEEQKASFTGTADNAVTNGQWNMGPGGVWTYRTNGIFKNTWGNIKLENGKTGWFWFDKNGVMATGWKEINGKWYYFNEAHDGSYGMMLSNTTTPDGKKVGADGARID